MPVGIPLVISAPSGAGKSTLVRELRRRVEGLEFSVSHTTRAPRAGEADGVEYHFVDRPAFEAMIERGAFAEWAEVHGNLYGTSLHALQERLAQGVDVILDIDVQGALQLAEKVPEALLVFVLPPSWDELRRRLRGRGSDEVAVVERRLANARGELGQALRYHYLVVNDHLDRAAEELTYIVCAERCRTERRKTMVGELLKGER
ncbi:MAG: guanylate kinase [Proteobacteria bacterium]|nr:guanylate kinase [Pseudomonadota bacterium]